MKAPSNDRGQIESFLTRQLDGLFQSKPGFELGSPIIGGQRAAEAALERFLSDGLVDYGIGREKAYPLPARSCSKLSPYIRHGLLGLRQVEAAVLAQPSSMSRQIELFQLSLLRQEYGRHRYGRLAAHRPNRRRRKKLSPSLAVPDGSTQTMGCLELPLAELQEEGWLPDSARRWMVSHFDQRLGLSSLEAQDYMLAHLLDGSRAMLELGWNQPDAVVSLTRYQVELQAPGLCACCDQVKACPIDQPPRPAPSSPLGDPLLQADPDLESTSGPNQAVVCSEVAPEAVWLTVESMGFSDPALQAHPDLPAVFVFDEPLLKKLALSSKRLIFWLENLAELAENRTVEIYRGDPVELLAGRPLAATFTPVPGWQQRARHLNLSRLYPWSWMRKPTAGSIETFDEWLAVVEPKFQWVESTNMTPLDCYNTLT